MKGGRFLLLLIFGFLGFISYGEAVTSSASHICEFASQYEKFVCWFDLKHELRKCKVAAFYSCLTDGNKYVYTGYGCYDNFVQICKDVNYDARKFFKQNNFTNKLVWSQENVYAYICNDGFQCAQQKKNSMNDNLDEKFKEYEEHVKKAANKTSKLCDAQVSSYLGEEDMKAYDDPDSGGNGSSGKGGGPNGDSSGGSGNKLNNAFGLIGMMAVIIFGWNFIQNLW